MTLSAAAGREASALRVVRPFVLAAGAFALAEPIALASDSPLKFHSNFMYQGAGAPPQAGQLALDELAQRNELGPGRYQVEVHLNLLPFDQRELDFFTGPEGKLQPCLSSALLSELGANLSAVEHPKLLEPACVDLRAAIPGAFSDFDSSKLVLNISVPQIAMGRVSHRMVSRERWDSGINSAFVNYQAGLQYGHVANGRANRNQSLFLISGVNLGAWRLRSSQSLRNNDSGHAWERAYTHVERDVPGTMARFTLGETYTGGDVLRSVPIVGATLASDMSMLPDSAQTYAPVIRGVAQSRARLEVLQNGYPIYSTYVSAGPYAIDDLSTGGGSGELEIVLTEADGQVRRFTQAYSGLNNLMRQGTWRYRASAGRYNSASHSAQPMLWQGDLAVGLGWQSTLYGGLLFSDFYQARNLGLARDFAGFGALSLDVTLSDADTGVQGHDLRGVSYAIRYGKSFATRTNVRFAGYRYSTENYRDFDEALAERTRDTAFRGSRRSRLEASVYQSMGKNSSFSLSLSREDFWRSDYERKQFQVSFNTHHRGVSYGLYASQSLADQRTPGDREFGLTLSLPLATTPRAVISYDARRSGDQWTQRGSVSGSLDNHRYSYNASVSQRAERQRSATLSVAHQAPFAGVSAGYSQGSNYDNLSVNASGAMLVHGEGVVFGPYLGETMALVHVADTPGVEVANSTAVKTNQRGYALVPNLQPYRINQIELRSDHLGPELNIDNGTAQRVPTRGAVVKASFSATRRQPVVINARTGDGQPLPFGAQVLNATGKALSVVGQAGQIMLASLDQPQTLHVQWADSLCQLHLDPATMTSRDGYRLQALACDPNPVVFGTRPPQEHADDV